MNADFYWLTLSKGCYCGWLKMTISAKQFILFMLKYYFNFYSINIEWNIINHDFILKYSGFLFLFIYLFRILQDFYLFIFIIIIIIQ